MAKKESGYPNAATQSMKRPAAKMASKGRIYESSGKAGNKNGGNRGSMIGFASKTNAHGADRSGSIC